MRKCPKSRQIIFMNAYYSEVGITLYNAKMEEVVPRLPEKHFSVLVLDPPYTYHADHIGEMVARFKGCITEAAEVVLFGEMPVLSEFGYSHARPVDKMREVLEKSQGPVLDPYVGVGSTLLAAKQLGREAVGIEMDEKRCWMTAARLRGA